MEAPFVDLEVIRLTKNGVWLSDGEEITHQGTLKAFARNLKKEPDGYWITLGWNRKKIEVEDTSKFVTKIEGRPPVLHLNDDSKEVLNFRSLKFSPERLTCILNSGEEAKFLPPAYLDLLKELEQDEKGYFLKFEEDRIYLSA